MSEGGERSDAAVDPERFARGLAKYREVYGDDAIAFGPGDSAFFDLMMAQLFGEIWTREALAVPQRRLLVMGVLAAQGKWDTLQLQLSRALATGELTVDQVREVALHLIQYVGYPSSSDLFRVSETVVALHAQPPTMPDGDEELE